MPSLYKKFIRAENAKDLRPDGSGIGMFLVKNIIDAHNGQIDVQSEEGKGTNFIISLPLKQPATS